MASQVDKLTLQVAAATYKDMLRMVDGERRQRKDLLDGVSVQNFFSNTDSWDWLGINHLSNVA